MIETYIVGDITNNPVVFLHDGIGSCQSLDRLMQYIHGTTNRGCFAYSRPYHGKSSKQTLTVHQQITLAHETITSAGIANPTVFGHSDGGMLALLYAATHPTKNVVVTAPYVKYDPKIINTVEMLEHKFDAGGMPHLAEMHDDVDSMFYKWYDYVHSQDFAALDITGVLPDIKCPVAVLKYSNDFYMSDEHCQLIAAHAKDCTILILPGTKHSVHKRDEDKIVEFL